MKIRFKFTLIIIILLSLSLNQLKAQSVRGEITLNGDNKFEITPETNSVISLFKDFQTKKYELQFRFKAYDVPKNIYGETVVFFNFKTQIKKDGKLIKELQRKEPLPYLQGEGSLTAESFDFISMLSSIDGNDTKNSKYLGTLPEGEYKIVLQMIPLGFKGNINPLEIYFVLRRRPTR